ncbi:MAG: PilZ domain-containing protein [Bdellovibrionaceae bacterium]|nr:PilZ domain-containing protein [Pseudobdellovibrionaceae bacterium]
MPKFPTDIEDDEITEITQVGEPERIELDALDDEGTAINFRPATDRRRHPRFDAQVTTVVYSANSSFRTKTENISEGGLRLTDRLPQEFQYVGLEVLMIEEKEEGPFEYYMFKAKAVGNHDEGHRLQFTWVPAQTLTPYREFLSRLERNGIATAA